MAESQAAALQKNLPQAQAQAADQPRVLIPSPLKLTRKQEDDLMEHARTRFRTLSEELGRDVDYTAPNWVHTAANQVRAGNAVPFFAKRHLSHLIYAMEMAWRAQMLGGIWKESNVHLPLTRRTVQQEIARAISYFFGTSPWFSASPKPGGDDWNIKFADRCDRWAKFEAEESGLAPTLAATIELAFIQGEQVTKTIHERHVSYYKTEVIVAVTPDGKPFTALDGDYLYKGDRWIPLQPEPVLQAAPDGAQPIVPPENPAAGSFVLERDGRTPKPDVPLAFQKVTVDRKVTHFEGAKTKNVHYLDFLCALTEEDLQRAADIFHVYGEQLISVVSRLIGSDWVQQAMTAEQQVQAVARLTQQLMGGTPEGQGAAASQPRAELKENVATVGKSSEPEVTWVESWHHRDVNGDGVLESIVLIMDKDGKVPLHYNYAANVTADGLRPFTAHAINKVAGRWHGQGQVEILSSLQQIADLTLNRWNFAQMSAGRVDFWTPSLTVEGSADPNLKMNWGKSYTKRDASIPAGQILEPVYLREFKGQELQQILQLIIQMVTNMGGVANANDARMAGLDTGELATGIRNIEQSSEELFGKFIGELSPTVKESTTRHIALTLAHLDKPRVYRYFDYDAGSQQMIARLGRMDPDEARNLALDIELELTRYKAQQQVATADGAMKVVQTFYAFPPIVQQRAAPLARQQLRGFQIANADQIIVPLTPEEMQQAALQQQAAQPQPAAVADAAEPEAPPQQAALALV